MTTLAEALAWLLLVPAFLLWKTSLFKYMSFTMALSLVPTGAGIIIRRVWYRSTLKKCGGHLAVDFLGWIRTAKTEVGDNVSIGANSYVGLARLGSNIRITTRVTVMSGRHQHRTDSRDAPMSAGGGIDEMVTIGNDVWIGTGAIVGADIAGGCVVEAGAVVVHPTNPGEVVGGVPAKTIRKRMDG
jgi:acetyltransferase-like isoleucine patch superfamily enzyme